MFWSLLRALCRYVRNLVLVDNCLSRTPLWWILWKSDALFTHWQLRHRRTDIVFTHGFLSFFLSFFFFLFFLLRTERLTVLYLRLRVMCSHVPSYQCGGRVPVTPHAEVTPHCIQPFVAMHVRILPAACLFVAFFSFVTICILFHRLLSWVRIPYCFVGESSCEVCVASNPGPMFKRKNWAYGSVCLWTQYCRDLPYQGCWTGMNHWCRLKHKLAAVVKLLIFIDIWGSVL